jgi:hypothetical protein
MIGEERKKLLAVVDGAYESVESGGAAYGSRTGR